jgi:outer membrane protein assembly factor BamB
VIDSLVIVNPGAPGASLAAYDIDTGDLIWQGGNAGASYSSPQPVLLGGVEQVLDFNADGVTAHDRQTGRVLWNIPWISNPEERNNVCQPVVVPGDADRPDAVFLASGYGVGCGLFDIHHSGDKWDAVERWHNRNLKAKSSSVVMKDGFVYGLDEAILTCVELSTGKRRWKGGRYNYGQLLLAGDVILVQVESGEVAIVDASPEEFRELGRLEAVSDRTWNHPALAGRFLVVRNDREAACFELPVE